MPARLIAIGDIHGCLAALKAILEKIAPQRRRYARDAGRLRRSRAGQPGGARSADRPPNNLPAGAAFGQSRRYLSECLRRPARAYARLAYVRRRCDAGILSDDPARPMIPPSISTFCEVASCSTKPSGIFSRMAVTIRPFRSTNKTPGSCFGEKCVRLRPPRIVPARPPSSAIPPSATDEILDLGHLQMHRHLLLRRRFSDRAGRQQRTSLASG